MEDAARVTRLVRTSVAQPVPDLIAAVLAAAPAPRTWTVTNLLRALLALVGFTQLSLTLSQILDPAAVSAHQELHGATVTHSANESAAWTIAVAVAFLWVAWRTARAGAVASMLGVFVFALVLLSAVDFAGGRVDLTRLATHMLVLGGYALLFALAVTTSGGWSPLRRMRDAHRGTSPATDDHRPEAGPGDNQDLRPTARHAA